MSEQKAITTTTAEQGSMDAEIIEAWERATPHARKMMLTAARHLAGNPVDSADLDGLRKACNAIGYDPAMLRLD